MLGFHPANFWGRSESARETSEHAAGPRVQPLGPGAGLRKTSAALEQIAQKTTLIGGLDHGVAGGHFAIHAFLSGVRQIDAVAHDDANVTIDQVAAGHVEGQTRFSSLTVGSESGIHGGCQISWTRNGTRVPPIPGPEKLFRTLFEQSSAPERDRRRRGLDLRESILDGVREQAGDFQRRVAGEDRRRLDHYFTAIRDVEKKLSLRRQWVDVDKPDAPMDRPVDRNMVEDLPLLYDLIVLALQTDSTRVATLEIGGDFDPGDLGVSGGYHSLSHHGKDRKKIDALATLETYQVEQFVRFIEQLNAVDEAEGTLLDRSRVLFGSGMGDANSHTNRDLPIVLCGRSGGRFVDYQGRDNRQPPLCNLYVDLLQEFGVETDRFGTSTGTLGSWNA